MGSLRNLRNFDGVRTNSQVNLMIVCLTNDPIDDDMLNVLKELVSQTNEGALLILRYTLADEMGQEKQLEKVLARVKGAIRTFRSKETPLI